MGGGGGGSNPASNLSPAAGMEAMGYAGTLGGESDYLFQLLTEMAAPLLFGVPPTSMLGPGGPQEFYNTMGHGTAFSQQGNSPWQTGNFSAYGAPGLIMQQAFDPQQQLYQSTKNSIMQDTMSQLAAQGLSNTPAGASALGNALGTFNLDWQNNLLNREITGATGAENLFGGFINAGNTATNPLQAATSDLVQLEKIGSDAKTADQNRSAQESQFGASSALGGLQSIGGFLGK